MSRYTDNYNKPACITCPKLNICDHACLICAIDMHDLMEKMK